ncbi:MAG: hypothetical protein IH586_07885, partial [Anaerolineaceae bacterium]|nr:hypothetical protein [Anaerolineaceae bacterium]
MPDPVDLELTLRGSGGDAYSAEMRVRRGDDVELRYGPFPLTISRSALGELSGQAAAYTRALTDAVFPSARMWAAFVEARSHAAAQETALRVRLL